VWRWRRSWECHSKPLERFSSRWRGPFPDPVPGPVSGARARGRPLETAPSHGPGGHERRGRTGSEIEIEIEIEGEIEGEIEEEIEIEGQGEGEGEIEEEIEIEGQEGRFDAVDRDDARMRRHEEPDRRAARARRGRLRFRDSQHRGHSRSRQSNAGGEFDHLPDLVATASAWSAPAVRAWWLTAGHAVRVARHHHRAAATAERTLALTGRIGNPSHSGVESGFATITETVLDKDYFLMATYTKDQQAIQSVRDSQENPKLVSDTSLEAEAKLVDSGAVGVGGRSLHAYRGTPAQLSATEIERTLRQCQAGRAKFPFTAVVDYYQAVGRNSVRPDVAAMLSDLHGMYRDDPLLAAWLPMTFDTNHGTYSTYVGLDYFDHVVQSAQRSADCERVDAYIAAAAIDLALLETRAAAASPHGPQLARTSAATPAPPQPDTSCDIAALSGR
jgi:hypothetical protein